MGDMWHCICGHEPCDGLDCGPGPTPRKRAASKSPDETARIRAAAWKTRRAKYGPRGNNGSYRRA